MAHVKVQMLKFCWGCTSSLTATICESQSNRIHRGEAFLNARYPTNGVDSLQTQAKVTLQAQQRQRCQDYNRVVLCAEQHRCLSQEGRATSLWRRPRLTTRGVCAVASKLECGHTAQDMTTGPQIEITMKTVVVVG